MDTIERLSFAIERNANRVGWDTQPELHVIYDTTDMKTATAYKEYGFGHILHMEGYAATPIIPSEILCPSPVRALFYLAYNISSNDPIALATIDILKQPGFIGLALQVEVWSRIMDPEERKIDRRLLADIPGSVERRSVITTLRDGTICSMSRARGQKPSNDKYDRPPEGPLIESLQIITAIAAGKSVKNMRLTIPRGMGPNYN